MVCGWCTWVKSDQINAPFRVTAALACQDHCVGMMCLDTRTFLKTEVQLNEIVRTGPTQHLKSSSKEMDQILCSSPSVLFLSLTLPRFLTAYYSLGCDSGRTQRVLGGTHGSSPAVVSGGHLLAVVLLRTQTRAVSLCTAPDTLLTLWHLRATPWEGWEDEFTFPECRKGNLCCFWSVIYFECYSDWTWKKTPTKQKQLEASGVYKKHSSVNCCYKRQLLMGLQMNENVKQRICLSYLASIPVVMLWKFDMFCHFRYTK